MTVTSTRIGTVAVLTLNRPDKLNALSYRLITELHQALGEAESDSGVRAVVLTGAGDRAFSAGADIADLRDSIRGGVARALREVVAAGQGLTSRIERFDKPVVAAVNGIAYGGGCEIVEACTLAVASRTATFAKPEITLGFPPPFGGTQRLPRHVGRKRALQMILTAEPIEAARAASMGLINEVVEPAELLEAAVDLAARASRCAPTAVAACLAAVTRGSNVSIDEGLGIEAAWFASTVDSAGVRDGLAAFFERPRAGAEP